MKWINIYKDENGRFISNDDFSSYKQAYEERDSLSTYVETVAIVRQSSHPEQGEQGEDPFIQKHLAIIMDKTLEGMIITHIEKMFGSLEMASVEHFIETGKINGSLYLNIKELAKKFAAGWHNQAAKLSSPPPEGQDEEQDKLWDEIGELLKHTWTLSTLKQKLSSTYLLIKK